MAFLLLLAASASAETPWARRSAETKPAYLECRGTGTNKLCAMTREKPATSPDVDCAPAQFWAGTAFQGSRRYLQSSEPAATAAACCEACRASDVCSMRTSASNWHARRAC